MSNASDKTPVSTPLSVEQRTEAIKRSEAEGRKGIGQVGVESASGRDRAGEELPRNLATNQNGADTEGLFPQGKEESGT